MCRRPRQRVRLTKPPQDLRDVVPPPAQSGWAVERRVIEAVCALERAEPAEDEFENDDMKEADGDDEEYGEACEGGGGDHRVAVDSDTKRRLELVHDVVAVRRGVEHVADCAPTVWTPASEHV
eukprot:CAMPEP_0205915248 /NCGR_PEP_ID=MMETSP1325-20131115/7744_1 /ASSEMBLY_ACC=CAM_ASM_000708 /TAXON_ID=236786 /ORGANISM="Florenciella sp., Strain RCC1007" /LENGTH=122 /DNA_ID=CAMNT_0053282405 /DNA_START=358 /DNA_END=726 /DNA_ORIENTATION=-